MVTSDYLKTRRLTRDQHIWCPNATLRGSQNERHTIPGDATTHEVEKRPTRRLIAGARLGLMYAAVFSGVAGGTFLFAGREAVRSRFGFSFSNLAAFCFVSGAICGSIAGILSPLCRSRAGAAAVGVVASAPMFILFPLFFHAVDAWTLAGKVTFVLVCSLVTGPPGGLVIKSQLASSD
jgi:hypothetical protein